MFSYYVTALLLLANLLTGHKRRVGWLVGCVADLSFAVWGAATAQYGFLVGSGVFFVVRVRNYLRWRREDGLAEQLLAGRPMAGEPKVASATLSGAETRVLMWQHASR